MFNQTETAVMNKKYSQDMMHHEKYAEEQYRGVGDVVS